MSSKSDASDILDEILEDSKKPEPQPEPQLEIPEEEGFGPSSDRTRGEEQRRKPKR